MSAITDFINSGNAVTVSPFAGCLPCHVDDSAATKYYGFQASNGAWYIMKSVVDTGVTIFTYAWGNGVATSYTTNWGNRASLTYGLPNA